MKVLITGAAGRIGSVLRRCLPSGEFDLVLGDIRAREGGGDRRWRALDVTDPASVRRAMAGCDAVVHLAGHPNSRDWHIIDTLNVAGTRHIFEAAADLGISRVVYASSIHVVGLYDCDCPLSDSMPVWPDSPYGLSKVFGEMLLRYFCDAGAFSGVALRISSFRPSPGNARELRTWIGFADMARLTIAALTADVSGFSAVWGISANQRADITTDLWERLGYAPKGDADRFVERLIASGIDVTPVSEWPKLGGAFASRTLDGDSA